MNITKKSVPVAYYIEAYIEKHHYAPSIREIATELKTSTSAIQYCLVRLEALGIIERDPIIARSIRIKKKISDYEQEISQPEDQ